MASDTVLIFETFHVNIWIFAAKQTTIYIRELAQQLANMSTLSPGYDKSENRVINVNIQ